MKKLLSIILVFAAMGARAQQQHHPNFICSYYGEAISTPVQGFTSSAAAQQIIKNIIDVIGLEPKFQIRSANIPNAAAVISSGQRFILYNPSFINAINQAANTHWASIAILAHEIGHHLNGHTLLGTGSRPDIELEADHFSGFVLRKMGASLGEAQLSMNIVASRYASKTHPGKTSRLTSIENGWNKADAQMTGNVYREKTVREETRPVTSTRSTSRYVLNEKYILYTLKFNQDAERDYYITTGNNFVTIRGNEVVVLGKAVATKNSSYPIALTASGKTAFYISRNGKVINTKSVLVGSVK